jgi:predicted outer membrane repeat protein
VVIQNSSFDLNSADNGGVFAIFQAPSLQIQDCSFSGNAAINPYTSDSGKGGVVFVHEEASAHILLSSSNFTNNMANKGGAICVQNASVLNMSGVQLVGNIANEGGAFYAKG